MMFIKGFLQRQKLFHLLLYFITLSPVKNEDDIIAILCEINVMLK